MKSTLTMCAVTVLFIGVTLPAAAVPTLSYAPPTVERTTLASQAIAASGATLVPVSRDGYSVEKIVEEVAVASTSGGTFSGSYSGAFAGFLSVWPASGGVNDGFGYRDGGEFHGGIDIMAGAGATIVSAAPGVVTAVSFDGGWGQYVKIDHGSGVSTLYAHMISGSPTVSPGQTVNAGDMIGSVGSTGYVTVAHLHFETYIGGTRVDPMGLLP